MLLSAKSDPDICLRPSTGPYIATDSVSDAVSRDEIEGELDPLVSSGSTIGEAEGYILSVRTITLFCCWRSKVSAGLGPGKSSERAAKMRQQKNSRRPVSVKIEEHNSPREEKKETEKKKERKVLLLFLV